VAGCSQRAKGKETTKTLCCVGILAALLDGAHAQIVSPTSNEASSPGDYVVAERGAHEKVWARVTRKTNTLGQVTTRTNRAYVELATGLCFTNSFGGWEDSQELIEPAPGGAIARYGQHKAFFPTDLRARLLRRERPCG
jgi:hypothetical protein